MNKVIFQMNANYWRKIYVMWILDKFKTWIAGGTFVLIDDRSMIPFELFSIFYDQILR